MRNLLLSFFLFLSTWAMAEQTYRLEVAYVQPYQASDSYRSTYMHGAQIGGTVDFHLPYDMSVQTGLSYMLAYGYNVQRFTTGKVDVLESLTRDIYNHSIIIPVRYTYTQKVWSKLALFAYAGPNVQIGLAQTENLVSTLSAQKEAQFGISSGTTDAYQSKDLRRFNLQFGLGGGIQWDRYRLQSGYDFGLTGINPHARMTQSGWYASLSYAF